MVAYMPKNRGFTLIEVVIAVVIVGFMATLGASAWLHYTSIAEQLTKRERQEEIVAIKNTLLMFAANDNNGRLPTPYTGSGFNSTCLNITDATVKAYLALVSHQPIESINSDNSIVENVRACQVVSNLSYNQAVAGFGGSTVTLTYDAGVAYQTQCAKGNACNTAIPGPSANYAASGWSVTSPDSMPVEYSTLAIQQAMWDRTYERLLHVRNVMNNYRIEMVRTNAADDTTNWNIAPNLVASPDLSGSAVATNQACYDGWYDLSDTDVNVLPLYGLNQAVNSITEFGGRIEYCRDYDVGDSGANTVPHVAALRINVDVSNATAPDGADVTNNLIISF